jgi:hypothetical protein
MPDWREQEATNETVFREMNEWTELAEDGPSPGERIDIYLCECSDPRCTDPIGMTRPEYESVRAVPVRFAIALDHENPEIDQVVTENLRFAIVEKFFGAAAKIARASDPRR